MSDLHIVGVRHHSPACARVVREVIRSVRPRHVLIEGPADMNPRLEELALPHTLPIALFSSYREGDRTHASWSPFCAYSPEWVALEEGRACGAQLRFMDLPAWHPAFEGVTNRYSDGERRDLVAIAELCRRFCVEGLDGLWDHLFEQPLAPEVLGPRLRAYFEALRESSPDAGPDREREAFMLAHLEAALTEGGPVVAVCGGFHAPVLARARARAGASFPATPEAPGARTYLVPYTFRRLDAFTGYQSGMPSPAFYQSVWERGPERACDAMLGAAVAQLRAKGQPVSAADLIAASTSAEGLARLRGHPVLTRSDLLDGLASALVKDSLEAPLPWTRRGKLTAGTDPLLVEILRAFSGEVRGKLAEQTPQPPLLRDVEKTLRHLGLWPTQRRRVTLKLAEPDALEKSRALHRVRVLQLPGFRHEAGPALPTDPILEERWELFPSDELEAAVIEASGYGPTLEQAAAGRLEEALLAPELELGQLSLLLAEALFTGSQVLADRVLAQVAAQAGREPDLGTLGAALARLLSVWRHDVLWGARGSAQLGAILAAIVERGLWLLEQLDGPTLPADERHVGAIAALRDTLRYAGAPLGLDLARAESVLHRRVASSTAPPAVRGASLGALWSLDRLDDPQGQALRAVRAAALPTVLGDFLAGLLRLAREQVVRSDEAIALIDALISGLPEQDFLIALPSLRLAFGYLPPGEKSTVAQTVLRRHGKDPLGASSLLKLGATPAEIAAGSALDDAVERVMATYGLLGGGDGA